MTDQQDAVDKVALSVPRDGMVQNGWTIIEMNPPGSAEWNFDIPYQWRTEQYGRAEFSVCVCWHRGKIQELWISPHQQPREIGKLYHVNVNRSATGLSVSYGATIWMVTWCKLHKAQNLSVYVPDDTNSLHIKLLSTVSLMFGKSERRP